MIFFYKNKKKMSIIFKFTADNTDVVNKLQEIRDGMAQMNWSDMAMGFEAIASLVERVAGGISGMLAPASELENVAAKLGVMLQDGDAGKELASSLQRMATNGVVPMQELQASAAALVGTFSDTSAISQWVGVFADIAAGSKLPASRLAELVARVEDMGKAEFTELANAGIPIFHALEQVTGKSTQELLKMSAAGEITRDTVLEAFKLMTAEGAKFHDLNATMSNTTAGSWDTLKASWEEVLAVAGSSFNDVVRPMLQGLSSFLQEHKDAIAEMLKLITKFALVWAGLKVASMVAGLMKAAATLAKMVTTAKSLRAALASSGGLVTLVNTLLGMAAWKLGEWLFGGSGDSDAETDSAVELAEEEAARAAAEAADHLKEMSNAADRDAEARRREVVEVLRACDSLAKFDEELAKIKAEGGDAGLDVEHEREMVKIRVEQQKSATRWEELQRREKNLKESDLEAHRKAKVDAFGGMSVEAQREWLLKEMARWGVMGDLSSAPGMKEGVRALQSRAAEANLSDEWQQLDALLKYVEKHGESEKAYAEMREKIRLDAKRDAFLLAGDKVGLARFDETSRREELRKGYLAAGLNEQEAAWYAGQKVARERKLRVDQQSQTTGGQGVTMLAGNLTNVGGGGRSLRLGDDQLSVSRKQLSALEVIRSLVGGIASKTTGIPVVV